MKHRAPLVTLLVIALSAVAFYTIVTLRERSAERTQREFVDGLKAGDLKTIKTAIADGYQVSQWNVDLQYEAPPLNFAVRTNRNVEIIKYLLDQGLSPQIRTREGRSPLYDAAVLDRADVVDLLIKRGADVNVVVTAPYTTDNNSPLDVAAFQGNVDVLRLLLAAKADVRGGSRFGGVTPPLSLAAAKGHLEIMELLIKAGAEVPVPIFVPKTSYATMKQAVCFASVNAYTRSLYNCRN